MTKEQRIRLSEHYELAATRTLNICSLVEWVAAGEEAPPRVREAIRKLRLRGQQLNDKSSALFREACEICSPHSSPPFRKAALDRSQGPFGLRLRHILALATASLLVVQCSAPPPSPPPPRPVRTITIARPEDVARQSFSGVARAVQTANVGFRVGGLVATTEVDVGDEVTSGEVIARLDERDFRLRVEQLQNSLDQAQAQLEAMRAGARREQLAVLQANVEAAQATFDNASREFRRFQELRQEQAVSQSEFEGVQSTHLQAQAALRARQQELAEGQHGARQEDIDAQEAAVGSLRAQLETAQAALSDTVLCAPFAGHVAQRLVDAFEQVAPQQPVIVLEDISKLEMLVSLSETAMRFRGEVVETRVSLTALPGVEFPAQIFNVGIDVDPSTRAYPVTVRFDNPDRRALPGMSGEVRFGVPSDIVAALIAFVPLTALVEDPPGTRWVWLVQDGHVHRRQVEIAEIRDQGVRLAGGLSPGDVVVTAGVHHLAEGQAVRLLSDEASAEVVQ